MWEITSFRDVLFSNKRILLRRQKKKRKLKDHEINAIAPKHIRMTLTQPYHVHYMNLHPSTTPNVEATDFNAPFRQPNQALKPFTQSSYQANQSS